jgi:hypothetical protein
MRRRGAALCGLEQSRRILGATSPLAPAAAAVALTAMPAAGQGGFMGRLLKANVDTP